ncbi:MAG: basic secretory protein-like protein [Verrucomicrobiales bacterium]
MTRFGLYLVSACLGFSGLAHPGEVQITVDASEAPELSQWVEDGAALMKEWYPRLGHLLASPEFEPPAKLILRIRRSDKGVGATSGAKIVISSSWIEKHPDDVGLLIHELVHVIQNYPGGAGPVWVTEGIADYLRWAIFEGKPAEKFPKPQDPDGFKRGYQPAAGFFLWLETSRAPGIVRRLNTAMRKGEYSPEIFVDATGQTVEKLWADYSNSSLK